MNDKLLRMIYQRMNYLEFLGHIAAGRLPGNVVMTGNVLLNGKKRVDQGVKVS